MSTQAKGKRNTLIETNQVAKWTNDVLIKQMDKFAFSAQDFDFVNT